MADFSLLIRDWFRLNGRELPWRETKDPYKIWLSEIILQQTRVDQGLNYYLKFVDRYPTIQDLAIAEEIDVLNLWQGLGYYSRARNLHSAAKQVIEDHNGEFPNSFETIIKLKGVGKYTAAAISSFAFKETQAVVDGNVYRVLSRVFDINEPIDSPRGQRTFQELADELITAEHPDEHNQAIMELGALICSPKSPSCETCPVSDICLARVKGNIDQRPVKSKKIKVTDKFFHYLIQKKGNTVYLEKRMNGIWKNMYQFPLIESDSKTIPKEIEDLVKSRISETVHILSHQRINAFFYHVSDLPELLNEVNYLPVPIEKIDEYPIPRLIDRFLQENDL